MRFVGFRLPTPIVAQAKIARSQASEGLLASLAGARIRVGQRAARSLPERRPAKFRRAAIFIWSKVAGARKRGNGVFKIIYKDKQGDDLEEMTK